MMMVCLTLHPPVSGNSNNLVVKGLFTITSQLQIYLCDGESNMAFSVVRSLAAPPLRLY